ncbi:F-box only protein 3-like [Oncorhynchus kisutch]|uniref:F-box only protein 3-like n=1 Tax=Oncorhynchus kisutch TaxID=8019 RepID=UPI0012DCE7D5|nr:F-box only protein 3-like [Oncorhynchus kisutch]
MAQDPSAIDMFITGTSMISSVFPPRDMTVSVSTSFLPELSSVDPPHFFITYRIRIEMANDALPENACRYWKITNANVNVEEVRGPGVVGEFPMMTLVKVHEYASCTTFSATCEYMEGHYTASRTRRSSTSASPAFTWFALHSVSQLYGR